MSQYRHLQLFVGQFNMASADLLFPAILGGCLGTLILGIFVCLKLGLTVLQFSFIIPLASLDSFIAVFLSTSFCSKVFQKSLKILGKFETRSKDRGRLCRKMVQSLQPLKIHFISNFVDNETPLVILNFAISQPVNLL